jgi:hypothetical protein
MLQYRAPDYLFLFLSAHIYTHTHTHTHTKKTDNRHNFSPWFYAIYLDFENEGRRQYLGLLAFLPQVLLLAATSVKLGAKDLPFCIAVQTMAFVTFNKVGVGVGVCVCVYEKRTWVFFRALRHLHTHILHT